MVAARTKAAPSAGGNPGPAANSNPLPGKGREAVPVARVRLTFYDGVRCIGGNKILLEADGAALFLDFGRNFGEEGRYFDEFLRPRSFRGLADLLFLDLLPPLEGIYRSDLEPPGLWGWAGRRPRHRRLDIQGVLLSHAHHDHAAHIEYLRGDVPVVAGPVTAAIAKAMQDAGPQHAPQVAYFTPRREREGLLVAAPVREAPYLGRPFVLLEPPGDDVGPAAGNGGAAETAREAGVAAARDAGVAAAGRRAQLAAFLAEVPAARELDMPPPRWACGETRVGGLRVRAFPVDHSIPGATAFAVETSGGWIVYTGDLRLHGARGHLTRRFLEEAAALEPLALLCEGTRPADPARGEPCPTEADVYRAAGEAVAGTRGLVVADFGPRNVERLLTFHRVARENGRRLAVTVQDAYLLGALAAAGEAVPVPGADPFLAVYVKERARRLTWESRLVEDLERRAPGALVAAGDVAAHQDAFVLCLSFYDLPELMDVNPREGAYIYSSSEAFNEEMHLDLDRLRAWTARLGLQFRGDPGDREELGREPGFHASGHIDGPGLLELVDTVRPRHLVVVHSRQPEWFHERLGGRLPVLTPLPGETVELPPERRLLPAAPPARAAS